MDRIKQAQRFGAWMKSRRTELRLSEGEAALKARIDRPTWSDYERAAAPERLPTERTLYGIADALKTPTPEVFDRAGVSMPRASAAPLIKANGTEGAAVLQEFTEAVLTALDAMRNEIAELAERVARLDSEPHDVSRPPTRRRVRS